MFFLVPAHPGCPRQIPQSRKTVVCVCVVRPVLEYCAPVWHYALTKDQTQQIEKIQKHAIRIIFSITQPSSCLHCLLPAPREQSIISRNRTSEKYPRVHTRTKRYCSFINYALNNSHSLTHSLRIE